MISEQESSISYQAAPTIPKSSLKESFSAYPKLIIAAAYQNILTRNEAANLHSVP